jgi:hypothetical protein
MTKFNGVTLVPICVGITRSQRRWLEQQAEEADASLSQIVRRAIEVARSQTTAGQR